VGYGGGYMLGRKNVLVRNKKSDIYLKRGEYIKSGVCVCVGQAYHSLNNPSHCHHHPYCLE